jgi:hypothetical protein
MNTHQNHISSANQSHIITVNVIGEHNLTESKENSSRFEIIQEQKQGVMTDLQSPKVPENIMVQSDAERQMIYSQNRNTDRQCHHPIISQNEQYL